MEFYNHCFLAASTPKAFNDAVVIMFPKPNQKDPTALGAHRPISLTQSLYKLYAMLLHHRLRMPLETCLRKTQYGFRPQRSTSQPVHIIRRILEKFERHGEALQVVCLDWAKAFDTISHAAIEASLLRLGVPEPMVQAVMSLYSNPEYVVRDSKSISATYKQHCGVRQGCPLSPLLFLICAEVVIRLAKKNLKGLGG